MDWSDRLNLAIEYIEKSLDDKISVNEAAKEARCSSFHFQRMFFAIIGITPSDYVRRRRLTLAATDLASGNEKVIDIALKYGVVMADDGPDCLIHVDDDGPGIPRADRRRVFQAFTRLDTSRDRDTGGFGLGLAIVQRVVAWHGGRVEISRSPLGGARFTIRWPGFLTDGSQPSDD